MKVPRDRLHDFWRGAKVSRCIRDQRVQIFPLSELRGCDGGYDFRRVHTVKAFCKICHIAFTSIPNGRIIANHSCELKALFVAQRESVCVTNSGRIDAGIVVRGDFAEQVPAGVFRAQ